MAEVAGSSLVVPTAKMLQYKTNPFKSLWLNACISVFKLLCELFAQGNLGPAQRPMC
jgi:hypothetical protein